MSIQTHTHIFTVSRAKDACSLKESKIKKLNIPYGKIHITTTTTTSTTKNTSKKISDIHFSFIFYLT